MPNDPRRSLDGHSSLLTRIVVAMFLLYALPTSEQADSIFHELLETGLQLCLMQVEVANRSNTQDSFVRKAAAYSIYQYHASLKDQLLAIATICLFSLP